MTIDTDSETYAISAAATARRATASLATAGGEEVLTISASGRSCNIPMPDWDALGDLPGGLPSRARGDQREKIIYNILQDAAGLAPRDRKSANKLRGELPNLLAAADTSSKRVLASVLGSQYWVRPGSGGSPSASRVEFPFPFHSALPGAFDYDARYKSFNGTLLAFLSWDGSSFDDRAIESLLDLFNSDHLLTVLDAELLRCADEFATRPARASADKLLRRREVQLLKNDLDRGALYPALLATFREDLRAVISLGLPRHDLVAAIILTFSVHIALYYYRLSFDLGQGIGRVAAAAAGRTESEQPLRFDGRLLFRIGVGGDRPVRVTDPCARSFEELDEQYLLALPASIEVANLLETIAACYGGRGARLPDLDGIASEMKQDPVLARVIDAGAACLALLYGSRTGSRPAEVLHGSTAPGSGIQALREIVLDRYRTPTNRLKQRGRDVVATLVRRRHGGNLIRNRGKVRFFEMDEEVLFLFVRWALARSARPQIPLGAFLQGLESYGLKPQDEVERDLLADTLERLGLLVRYSDAGEAQYIRGS